MSLRTFRIGLRGSPVLGGWRCLGLLVCAVAAGPVAGADENDYLKQIQVEANKVAEPEGAAPGFEVNATTEAEMALFEQELQDRYRGSYLFFKKLPRRSREEIFLEFQQGASISDIRKKIMSRFLHNE